MPVDPGFMTTGPEWATTGPEWSIEANPGAAAPAEQPGFGDMLTGQIGRLSETQAEGAAAARSLADGTATDVSSVVMAVERARLSMQLASQIRTKGVEAFQDIFHTQV